MGSTLAISDELRLPVDAITSTFGILAKKGAGKSNAAVVMAEEMWDAGVPWVAVDPKGDWWGLRSSGDGNGPGLPIVVFGGRHGDVPLEPTAGHLIADLVLAHRLTCVLDVSEFSKADVRRFLLAFADRLYRQADADPLHLFLEEAHEYLPQTVRGPDAELVGAWQRIVKNGRFKGLGCTLVSQRSAALNKDVLTQVDTLIVLRTTSPQDRAAVKAWVDVHADSAEMLDTLPSLADGEAWVWSPELLHVLERIRFRRRRTFDSGATPKVGQARKAPATLADVDLAAIKEQMADTIERSKADDPKELRRRIGALEKQLRERPAEPEPEVVHVVPPEAIEALMNAVASFDGVLDSLRVLRAALVDAAEELEEMPHGRPDVHGAGPSGHRAGPMENRSGSGRPEERPSSQVRREPRRAPVPRAETPAGDLPAGEHRILTAVAQHTYGVTKEQLTVLTGYKRSSRDTYLQRLRSRECVTVNGGRIHATDVGVAMLGGDFEPLPAGAALREHWLATLPEGERRILAELVDAYPDGVPRDDLSERTGYKRSSRDTYLQRLRSRQLVVVDDGEPRASDSLFDG